MKCEAGRLLACDCAKSVGSMGGETTEEVASGAGVDEIAKLLRAWVKVDVAGAESVGAGGVAEGILHRYSLAGWYRKGGWRCWYRCGSAR